MSVLVILVCVLLFILLMLWVLKQVHRNTIRDNSTLYSLRGGKRKGCKSGKFKKRIIKHGGNEFDFHRLQQVSITPILQTNYTQDQIKDELLELDKLYDNDKRVASNWKDIVKTVHPYWNKTDIIKSNLVGSVKITNAFMKISEFLQTFDIQKPKSMFDIASAPGMFIIAVDYKYYKRINNDDFLDWMACSYIPEGKSLRLQDNYKLFEKNPNRFFNVNMLVRSDCNNMITALNGKKFELVTGDVGMEHGYNELQELKHLDLQWSQAWLALQLIEMRGNIFLKMYSMITPNTIYLMELLSKYFDKLYIWKPYTSRILNNETYIVGLERNDTPLEELSFEKIESPKITNPQLFYSYFHDFANFRVKLINAVIDDDKEFVNGYINMLPKRMW